MHKCIFALLKLLLLQKTSKHEKKNHRHTIG